MRSIIPTLLCAAFLGCGSGPTVGSVSTGAASLVSVGSPSAGTCAFSLDVANTAASEVTFVSASMRFEDGSGAVFERTLDARELSSSASSPFLPAGGVTRFSFSETLSESGLVAPASGSVVLSGIVQADPPFPAVISLDVACDSF